MLEDLKQEAERRLVGRDNPIKNWFFTTLAGTLGGVPLTAMEKYARRKGSEHERVIEKIKATYW